MTALKFRDLLRSKPFKPFLVKTTDGDTFRVEHQDFALVSPSDAQVIIFDKDGHSRWVAMNHIVTLEPMRNGSKKPGKR
jgi:hypothetical protein